MTDQNLKHGTVAQIVEDNLGLVVTIVSRFGVKSANFDDCVCEGNIGLLTAAKKVVNGVYDSERSALSTFLGLWITQAVRRSLKNQNVIHVPEHAQTAGVRVEVGTIAEDYDPAASPEGESLGVEELLSSLGGQDRMILLDSIVNGLTNSEIGDKVGKSREWVRQRVAKVTANLRDSVL
jgi:RNA polymerase sigma factor (sigma-70 family)